MSAAEEAAGIDLEPERVAQLLAEDAR